ncbi:MAG: type II toxin-antitoxin system death-on-curing family toxin [Armatimonadetes bacterium]|nr:type II toxin-antitoxin system death-on-curing family toxin [Armatimonadota bacterium]
MRFLTLEEILALHTDVIAQSGGSDGVREMAAVESALAQPKMSFGDDELYPTIEEKGAALGFSLIKNHAFVDGNKRIGHVAMETFLVLNGYEISGSVDEKEAAILRLAASKMCREEFVEWVRAHVVPLQL